MYSIVVHPSAERDLEEALEWYEDQRNGLGVELLNEFNLTIEYLKTNPLSFPIRYSDKRICKVGKRFPYFVHYSCANNSVQIKAVFHGKRNPKAWESGSGQ